MAKMLLFIGRWSYFLPCVYLMASIPIFERIFRTSQMVIDEEFHLRQGKHFCAGHFDVWDNKITTFPGLYLLSSVLLPLKMCTTFALRFISLLASAFNLFLLIKIKEAIHGKTLNAIMDALAITLLPPMYFFAHLYYTDVVSITTFLGMYNCWLRGHHKSAALVGITSVLMRQTNIIWVVFFFVVSAANDVIVKTKSMLNDYQKVKKDSKEKVNADADFAMLFKVITYNLRTPGFLLGNLRHIIQTFAGYIFVIIAFICFVLYNGSIVVGDKTAHQATIHLPQVVYCSIFVLVFGVTLILQNGISAVKNCFRNWHLSVLLAAILAVIVKFNTVVHPYLLADNRHYTFYVWNRFYGKYDFAKYSVIPVYIFALFLMWESLRHKGIVMQLLYFVSLIVVLGLQSLIDVRYFLIPFLILRVNTKNLNWKCYLLETLIYVAINLLTLSIFFTKKIRWSNYDAVQRLIW